MLAVCTVKADKTIATWNPHLEFLTHLSGKDVLGKSLYEIPNPWSELLVELIDGSEDNLLAQPIGQSASVNCYKTPLDNSVPATLMIVVENASGPQSLENRLFHKERLAFVGQVAAGVAHEIGNPVTAIACLAQNIKLECEDSELLSVADQILTQTERVTTILQSLNYFVHGSSQGPREWANIILRECIDDAINLLSLGNMNENNNSSRLINLCPENLIVRGDGQRLTQVFINILSNARDASTDDGPVEISAWLNDKTGIVSVEILDQGQGIQPTHLGNIFEPFFTTKRPGVGTGLGLSIAKAIVDEHLGSIHAESPVGEFIGRKSAINPGTRFVVCLPGTQDQM